MRSDAEVFSFSCSEIKQKASSFNPHNLIMLSFHRKRLLFAGHDLAFADDIIEEIFSPWR